MFTKSMLFSALFTVATLSQAAVTIRSKILFFRPVGTFAIKGVVRTLD